MLEQLGVVERLQEQKKKKLCCKALSYRNNTVVRGALNIKASLSTKPNQQNKCC